MKNRLFVTLLTMLLIFTSASGLLTGCKQKTVSTAAGDEIKISILVHGQQVSETYKYRKEAQDAINKKLFKDLGFKVNITTTSYIDQFETMLSLDLAAGVNYDMIRATSGMGASYFQKGMLQDLTSLLGTTAPDIKAVVPAQAFAENSYQGKIFGIPTASFPISYGMWFRGDWLSKLNAKVPTNMAELEAVLKGMKESPIINKSKTVIPMAGSRDFFEMVFLGMFTDHPGDYIDENGKVVSKYFDPGYRTFTEKVASWYKNGYINGLLLNGDENSINDLVSKDKVGIHVGNAFQLEYTPLKSYNEQKKLDMKWALPFKADTKKYYSSGAGNDIVMFPKTSKVTEYALEYYNWFYNNKENSDLVLYGIKDKTYTETKDTASGKPFIGVPASEKTNTIKQPSDLIGVLGTNVFSTLQLYYTNPTRPLESAKAYDSCNTKEIYDNYHIDVTRYFATEWTGTLGTKFTDSKNMLIARVSEMMVGKRPSTDAEWQSMKDEFIRLGGQKAYDFYSTEYNKVKTNLTFLK